MPDVKIIANIKAEIKTIIPPKTQILTRLITDCKKSVSLKIFM